MLFAAGPPGCDNNDDCPDNLSCINRKCVNPCEAKPCGENALCNVTNHEPICVCPPNASGNPEVQCSKYIILRQLISAEVVFLIESYFALYRAK